MYMFLQIYLKYMYKFKRDMYLTKYIMNYAYESLWFQFIDQIRKITKKV